MTAPVLVIAYRRPDHVASVMQAVSVARPSQLNLACDGPNSRRPGEEDLVEATRNAMEQAIERTKPTGSAGHSQRHSARLALLVKFFTSNVGGVLRP